MIKINIGDGSHIIRAWVQAQEVQIAETSIPGIVGDDVPDGHPENTLCVLHFENPDALQVMINALEALYEYLTLGEREFSGEGVNYADD